MAVRLEPKRLREERHPTKRKVARGTAGGQAQSVTGPDEARGVVDQRVEVGRGARLEERHVNAAGGHVV